MRAPICQMYVGRHRWRARPSSRPLHICHVLEWNWPCPRMMRMHVLRSLPRPSVDHRATTPGSRRAPELLPANAARFVAGSLVVVVEREPISGSPPSLPAAKDPEHRLAKLLVIAPEDANPKEGEVYNNMHWFSSIVANAKTEELRKFAPARNGKLSSCHTRVHVCMHRSLATQPLALSSLCSHSIQNGKCSRRTEFEASGSSHHRAYRADFGTRTVRCRGGRAWCTSSCRAVPPTPRLECHRVLASFGTHRISARIALMCTWRCTRHMRPTCCA